MHPERNHTSLRWMYLFLFVLENLTRANRTALHNVNSEMLLLASKSKKCKKKALLLVDQIRRGKELRTRAAEFVSLLRSESSLRHPELGILTPSDHFEKAIDTNYVEGISDDGKKVLSSLHSGLSIISGICTDWHTGIIRAVDMVSGIIDKKNVINSGFIKDVPGFFSFNVNCEPAIIGEQIVHESTHLQFDNMLFFDDKAREFVRSLPPVYSIFAGKPRSAELVLHGLFSYTSVYHFWKQLGHNQLSRRTMAKKREKTVLKYIQRAILDLDNVLDRGQWKRINRLFSRLCPLHSEDSWSSATSKIIRSKDKFSGLGDKLSGIETAELLLAMEGNKVSRISKSLKEVDRLIAGLTQLPVYYCFSDYFFESSHDENLGDFKNVITSTYRLDDHTEGNPDIHIYLSKSKTLLKRAFFLDQHDDCGDLFGIPKCCQDFFRKNWNTALRNYKGDLARVPYRSERFTVNRDLIYTPFAMYFGGGLCWHFTCRRACRATEKLVNERLKILSKYPSILKSILSRVPAQIDFSPQGGYRSIYRIPKRRMRP